MFPIAHSYYSAQTTGGFSRQLSQWGKTGDVLRWQRSITWLYKVLGKSEAERKQAVRDSRLITSPLPVLYGMLIWVTKVASSDTIPYTFLLTCISSSNSLVPFKIDWSVKLLRTCSCIFLPSVLSTALTTEHFAIADFCICSVQM